MATPWVAFIYSNAQLQALLNECPNRGSSKQLPCSDSKLLEKPLQQGCPSRARQNATTTSGTKSSNLRTQDKLQSSRHPQTPGFQESLLSILCMPWDQEPLRPRSRPPPRPRKHGRGMRFRGRGRERGRVARFMESLH